jgi:hypothetical protein
MANLTIEKTYQDGAVPTAYDFDNICDSLEVFLNTTKLSADNIEDNSITASTSLAAGSVAAGNIEAGAITTAKIANNAVTSGKIATSAVTTAKLATGAVSSAKLADGAVTSAKLANSAITNTKKPTTSWGTGYVPGTVTNGSGVSMGTVTITSVERPVFSTLETGTISLTYGDTSGSSFTQIATLVGEYGAYYGGNKLFNASFACSGFLAETGTATVGMRIPSSSFCFLDLSSTSSQSRSFGHAIQEHSARPLPGTYTMSHTGTAYAASSEII